MDSLGLSRKSPSTEPPGLSTVNTILPRGLDSVNRLWRGRRNWGLDLRHATEEPAHEGIAVLLHGLDLVRVVASALDKGVHRQSFLVARALKQAQPVTQRPHLRRQI